MPEAPRTGDAVLELVRKSELADDDVLNAFLLRSGPLPLTATDTATRLVQAGILTPFQARLILQGKHKGFRLGPYRILDLIGTGGMGQVFLAEHVRLHRRVAVKVLPPRLALDKAGVDRFYREARAVAALDHPNVVHAYDVACDRGTHFLVLEYVEGKSLAALLDETGGRLPVGKACGYAIQVAAGLQHAHDKGISHRDVKPTNLLLDREGVIKILDMGIARFFQNSNDAHTEKLDPGVVMGTADYIAPEQATACLAADHRADVYSLGATLYHLVTGQPPFSGTTTAKLVAHQLQAVTPAHSIREDVPEELSAIIARMMAKDPTERYQTAAEVITALLPFAGGVHLPTSSGSLLPVAAVTGHEDALATTKLARNNRLLLTVLAVVVLAGTLIAIALLRDDPRSDTKSDSNPAALQPGSTQPPDLPDVFTLAFKLDVGKSNVESAVFTPDDKLLITAGADRLIRVWDGATGKPIHQLEGHGDNVRGLSLLPDGKRVLSASADKTIKLWNAATGELLQTYEGHTAPVVNVAALPNGRRFLSTATDGTIWLWNLDTREVVKKYDRAPLPVYALAVTRDGRRAIAGTWDSRRNAAKPEEVARLLPVGVWAFDVETGKKLRELASDASVSHVRVSSDGRRAVFGTTVGPTVWDLDTGSFRAFSGVTKRITGTAFTRDGRHVLATGYEHALHVWDVATGKLVAGQTGMPGQGFSIATSNDGKRAIVVGASGGADVWNLPVSMIPKPADPNLPRMVSVLTGGTGSPEDVVFSPDGMRIIGASNPDKLLHVWEVATGEEIGRLKLPQGMTGARGLALLPGDRLASCGVDDPAIHVWNLRTGEEIHQLTGKTPGGFISVAALPDGRLLATATDQTVRLRDMHISQELARFDVKVACRGLAVTPDGTRFLVGCDDKTIRLWDLATAREARQLPLASVPWRIAVTPDSRWAAIGNGNVLQLWQLETGETRVFDAPEKYVDGVAFTRGGRFVLAGSMDRGLYAWAMPTGRLAWKAFEHGSAVRAVTVSPDGRLAATSSTDGTIVVWQLPETMGK